MANRLKWQRFLYPQNSDGASARSRPPTCHCYHPHAPRQAHSWHERQVVMRVMAKGTVGIFALSYVTGIPERTLRHWRAQWERWGWIPRTRERLLRQVAAMPPRQPPGRTEPGDGRPG